MQTNIFCFSFVLFLVSYGKWHVCFSDARCVFVFFILGGVMFLHCFFGGLPLRRRCFNWNKSCQFGDAYDRPKVIQIFIV